MGADGDSIYNELSSRPRRTIGHQSEMNLPPAVRTAGRLFDGRASVFTTRRSYASAVLGVVILSVRTSTAGGRKVAVLYEIWSIFEKNDKSHALRLFSHRPIY